MTTHIPLLEFDPNPVAILNPHAAPLSVPAPKKAVLCFFQDVLADLHAAGRLTVVGDIRSEIGSNPIYLMEENGERLLVTHPGVGAPLAVGMLEEVIAMGVEKVIVCGGCGVLDKKIAAGHPVVLSSAVRDEGTSFHYLPPGREVAAHPHGVEALTAACQQTGMQYLTGKAWTTDGYYRETAARRAQRLEEGCLVVEMEASAFFAAAQFRQIILGEIVYGGDLVVPEGWDPRRWTGRRNDRETLFWTAVRACCLL